MRAHIVIILTPLIKWIGKVKAPFMEKPGLYHYYEIEKILRPGDIILSTIAGHLSNIANPSPIKHAIAYYGMSQHGQREVPYIVEAIGEGVIKRPSLYCIGEKNYVAIMRPKETVFPFTPENIRKFQNFLDSCIGASYDFKFILNSDGTTEETQNKFKNFYCSELCFLALKNVFPEGLFELRETWGEKTVTPSDFFNARDKFDLIYELKSF